MPHLRISCLGDFSVTLAGKPITADFDTDQTRALLIYLVIEAARPHPRERLAGLLWPDQPNEHALHNLRQRLLRLRKTLGDDCASTPFLLITRDTVQWNSASDYWLDAQAFDQALAAAYRHYQRRTGQGGLNIRALKQAVQLFRGQFLELFDLNDSDLFAEWASLHREDRNHRAVEAWALLADYHERRGEFELARQAATRMIKVAPWEETAQTQLMRLLALDKQWSAAQHQYALLRRYLHEQLAVEPTRATVDLFNQIRAAAARNEAFPPRFPLARHNLPVTPTAFVGREAELDFLSDKFSDPECRLLTLLGPGGIGKTRLAVEAAWDQVGSLPDGVFFAPLVAISTPEHFLPAIAEALELSFTERSDPQAQLMAYLRSRRLLLVLDNFEQLLAHAGSLHLLSEMLQQAPGLILLVTSRERLNLQEEYVFILEGLAYPPDLAAPLESATACEALALFARRARQVRADFTFDASTLPAVIHICQLLAGLPLGVELAAAATWDCTCDEIAQRIARDFDELSASAANVPARHRSLRAAFEVSWQLLTEAQQAVFCQLAVFRGGFSAAAASVVAAAAPGILDPLLSALVDKSLLRRGAAGRYDLHEAIRQYAADKLATTPELASAAAGRHAHFYASLIANQNGNLKGSQQAIALEGIHQEIENARRAWEWLIENHSTAELCRCLDSLYQYFNIRSYFAEGRAWFQQAVQAFSDDETAVLAFGMSLTRLGALAFRTREHALALETLTRSQAIFNRLDEPAELALCQVYLSGLHLRQTEYDVAIADAQHSLALYRSSRDRWGEAHALYLLGLIKNRQGLFEAAQPLLEEAVAVSRRLGSPHLLIAPLNLLGDIACIKGDYVAAEKFFQESLEISRALHDRYNQGLLLNNLATVYQAQQQYAQEKVVFEASLAICREIGDRDGEANALNGLGEMAVHLEDYAQAAAYSQQALQIAHEVGEVWTVIVCLNNLGEAFCGLGKYAPAEANLQQALQAATEIEAQDLVARITATLGRVYQRRGERGQAVLLLQTALAHPALEDEPRTKARRWLAELEIELAR